MTVRKSSLKIKDEIATKQARGKEIVALCKKEVRDMTEDEEKEVNALKREIEDLKKELEECKKRAEELTFDDEDENRSEGEDNDNKEENSEDEDPENKEENKRSMTKKKNFSLARAIRSVVENKPFDKVDEAFIEESKIQARNAGVSTQGQIVLPEKRAVITVTAEGEDIVETKIEPILMPLRPDSVLRKAGVKFVSGLQGDVQYPVMGKENCFFEGEVASAQDGASGFTHVTLSPKRITAYIDVSRKALIQAADNVDLENAIIADLQAAIEEKIESTFLGSSTGTTTQYAGIFGEIEPTSGITDFKAICNLEADVEDANVKGECVYVMGTKAKASLRNMPKSSKTTQLVMENGEVDGTKAISTSMVSGKNYIYGDFSNAVVGSWNTNILVDPYTQATKSTVRVIAETWVDAKILRKEAFVTGTLAANA